MSAGEGEGDEILCVGFSAWKRAFVGSFIRPEEGRPVFVRGASAARSHGLARARALMVWGGEPPDEIVAMAREHERPIWRMEDGFLRSVGLGSDLERPASLVIDTCGIYFDPQQPSDLERTLSTADFDVALIARAAALRETIVERGISKYNVGRSVHEPIGRGAGDRRRVLVVGQVEDDASIRLGSVDVVTNLDLLEAARRARPEAFLLFKPHPDVVNGNRDGDVSEGDIARLCDEVQANVPLADCLAWAEEVHTITSLVGFEALLRGLHVAVYGQPFYAGWGLTDDRHPLARRTRRLSLDELVAGALILYPRYVSRGRGELTEPETIIEELERERMDRGDVELDASNFAGRLLRKLVNLVKDRSRGR